MEQLLLFVSLLMQTRLSRQDAVVALGRELVACLGLPLNPVGTGNVKTATASTYRPVGVTCPSCPFEESCYAIKGMVRFHQERASHELLPSLTAAALAMIAAYKAGTLARLHVSGDFVLKGEVDNDYIYGLAELGTKLHEHIGERQTLAWSYTHCVPDEFEPYRLLLRTAGIEVLYSGSFEIGGAVLWPFNDLDTLRQAHPNTTIVKCRFDAGGTTCRDCQLCPSAWSDSHTIVFDPRWNSAEDIPTLASTGARM